MHNRARTDRERLDFLEVYLHQIQQHPYEPRVEVQTDWHDGAYPAVGRTVREAVDVAMNHVEMAMARGDDRRAGRESATKARI